MKWFLDNGANYRISVWDNNATLLPYVGFFGDVDTVDVFRKARLCNIDTAAKDTAGETAMDTVLSPDRVLLASADLIGQFALLLS